MRTNRVIAASAATVAVLLFGSTAQAFWPLVTAPPPAAPSIVTPPTPTPPVVVVPPVTPPIIVNPPPKPPYCPPVRHNPPNCQTPEPSTLLGGLTGLATAFGWAARRRSSAR